MVVSFSLYVPFLHLPKIFGMANLFALTLIIWTHRKIWPLNALKFNYFYGRRRNIYLLQIRKNNCGYLILGNSNDSTISILYKDGEAGAELSL